MASFLTSAFEGANKLSNLVDRVAQLKDNIEKTLDSAVGQDDLETSPTTIPIPVIAPHFQKTNLLESNESNLNSANNHDIKEEFSCSGFTGISEVSSSRWFCSGSVDSSLIS